MKDKKNIVIIAASIVVVALIIAIVVLLGKRSNESIIEKELKDLGATYYEDYYYVNVAATPDERTEKLTGFSDYGININLENLEVYNNGEFKDKIATFKNSKTKKACNKENTKVIIKPKSPYGKSDYELSVELDCGFDKK